MTSGHESHQPHIEMPKGTLKRIQAVLGKAALEGIAGATQALGEVERLLNIHHTPDDVPSFLPRPFEAPASDATISYELSDDITREVLRIVHTIGQSAALGKFDEGTQFQTGDHDLVYIPHTPLDDFEMYPKDSGLAPLRDIRQTITGHLAHATAYRQEDDNPYPDHYLSRMGLRNKTKSLVTYKAPVDYRDRNGREAYFTDLLFVMPVQEVDNLFDLIQHCPDAAELFFQHAAQGIERTDSRVGIGRRRSEHIVLVDERVLSKRIVQATWERQATEDAARRIELRSAIDQAITATYLEGERLRYSRPFGNVGPLPPDTPTNFMTRR